MNGAFLTPKDSECIGSGDVENNNVTPAAGEDHHQQLRSVFTIRDNRRSNKPRIKTFPNGVRVPAFEASDSEDCVSCVDLTSPGGGQTGTQLWNGKFPDLNSAEVTELMEMFRCPICQDYLIEATATSCGHTFCATCLESWKKVKPICPLCSKQVKCHIRLFNDDLLIEKMINKCDDFPQDIARGLYQASKSRMDRQLAARHETFARLRDRLDETVVTLRCKGVWATVMSSGLCQMVKKYWTAKKRQQPQKPKTDSFVPQQQVTPNPHARLYIFLIFCVGMSVGAVGSSLIASKSTSNFLYYMYLCLSRYDGSIPEFLKQYNSAGTVPLVGTKEGGWWWWWNDLKML
ncbi:uncharacterized protein LOC118437714 [Folsomia candida]|nr:uncharacterized protein LOC118437714 [Folsomia candida]